MVYYLINNIPVSFTESELVCSFGVSSVTPSLSLMKVEVPDPYGQSESVYHLRYLSSISASYTEASDRLSGPSVAYGIQAQDFTNYFISLPSVQAPPFECGFFGDGGVTVALPKKVKIYYRMMARDSGEPTVTYRSWTVEGGPDSDGSMYPSDRVNFPLSGSLEDIVISSSWEVSDP